MSTLSKTKGWCFLLSLALLIQSCGSTSPREYVEVAVLNTNNVMAYFRPGFIQEIQELKAQDRLTIAGEGEPKKVSAVEYVEQVAIGQLDKSIKKVESMPSNEEVKDLLAASLDFLQYGKKVFESDLLEVAKMIDEEKPEEQIKEATRAIMETHNAEIQKRLIRLDEIAFPYAEKHNVPLEAF